MQLISAHFSFALRSKKKNRE